jgi:hypothetical protein
MKIVKFLRSRKLAFARRLSDRRLGEIARRERSRDARGLPTFDPGIDSAASAALDWLCAAQDNSTTHDGGVSRNYSVVSGWNSSYPETTGYIVPTMLDAAARENRQDLKQRAERMLHWLKTIQFDNGAFQCGKIDSARKVPTTFNTGQILIGLARGVAEFDAFSDTMHRAATWLADTQDQDGCWRKFPTPYANPGEKAYETHVAWGLLEAARISPSRGYAEPALANIRWALTKQRENGWISDCCLNKTSAPLTHTLGYALRGIIEGYLFSKDSQFLQAAEVTALGLAGAIRDDGYIPGRLRSDWSSAADWACLTGNAQIAHCWLLLYRITGKRQYLDAGKLANSFVRRTLRIGAEPGIHGGVKGSFPIDGEYARFEFINWGAKFLIDSLMIEKSLLQATSEQNGRIERSAH